MTLGESIRMTRQKPFLLNKILRNMKAMKLIKAFCDDNKLDYAVIENEWLKSKTDKQ